MRANQRGLWVAAARPGFSYVELVTVLAIIAIVGALAAPRMASAMAYRRAEAAAYRIRGDFELARHAAMSASADVSVLYLPSGGPTIQILGVEDPDRAGQPFVDRYRPDEWGLEMVSVDLGHGTDVNRLMLTFDMYGKPDSGGSLTFRVGGHTRTISIDDDTGLVTITR